MSARLDYYLRNNIRTFRVALSDLSGDCGVVAEVTGATGKFINLRHVQLSKLNKDAFPVLLERFSTRSTTGTYTEVSPVRISHPNGSTFAGRVRTFTVAPTAGTLIDQFQEIDISTSEVMNEHYGDADGSQMVRLQDSTHTFAIVCNTSGVLWNGYLAFTEEP